MVGVKFYLVLFITVFTTTTTQVLITIVRCKLITFLKMLSFIAFCKCKVENIENISCLSFKVFI